MATYLVTGAAGFIASRTAGLLLERGDQVVGIDNLNDYYDVRVKRHRLGQLEKREGFSFIEGDIENRDLVNALFEEYVFDGVVNLAARAGVRYSMEDPLVYMTTNAVGTLNLLEGMRAKGVKKMVLASTSSLYAGQAMPFVESLPVNTPISPYAASKKAAEVMAYTYHHQFEIDVSILRYFTVYGPAGRPDMSIFRFIKWIDEGTPITMYGDGEQSRDFTYVDDIAAGTVAALQPVGFEVINLGGGKRPVSMNSVIGGLEVRLGKKAAIDRHPPQSADMLETWADISKAKELLDWEPIVGLDEGLDRSVSWYRENEAWLKEVTV